jgi:hypothetical protein
MFINQMVSLSPENYTEIVEAENDSFDLTAGSQLNDHMASISTDTIEKLILDINLILHHGHLPR